MDAATCQIISTDAKHVQMVQGKHFVNALVYGARVACILH